MATQNPKKKASKLDPKTTQNAFESMSSELGAVPAGDVMTPNSDAQQAAVAALALVDVMEAPSRANAFDELPERMIARDASRSLERAALATWYAASCLQDEQALASGAKVSVDVMERATKLRAKLLKQLEYHLDESPQVLAQLADIRIGAGYQDMASDLSRLGRLHGDHAAVLSGDARYDANDAATAQTLATEIVESLRASMGKEVAEWTDKRNRAWTVMAGIYSDVIAAAQFVFRKQPSELALYVPLKTASIVSRSRGPAAAEAPVAAPPVARPPAAPAAAPPPKTDTGNGSPSPA